MSGTWASDIIFRFDKKIRSGTRVSDRILSLEKKMRSGMRAPDLVLAAMSINFDFVSLVFLRRGTQSIVFDFKGGEGGDGKGQDGDAKGYG